MNVWTEAMNANYILARVANGEYAVISKAAQLILFRGSKADCCKKYGFAVA